MVEYKIVEKGENPSQDVIEKTGLSVRFTLESIDADKPLFEKKIVEMQGQVALEEAKMANIEAYHPFVKEMSEQDLFTAHMYQEAKAIVIVGKKKIEDIQARLDFDAAEKIEIMRQIPELAATIAGATTQAQLVVETPYQDK